MLNQPARRRASASALGLVAATSTAMATAVSPADPVQFSAGTAVEVQAQAPAPPPAPSSAPAPTPGSEAALRRLIAGILSGQPNYGEMSPELAQATRRQLPMLQPGLAAMGAVRSVAFRGVGNDGWDVYDVKHEHGWTLWRIALGKDGIIAGALVTPAP